MFIVLLLLLCLQECRSKGWNILCPSFRLGDSIGSILRISFAIFP